MHGPGRAWRWEEEEEAENEVENEALAVLWFDSVPWQAQFPVLPSESVHWPVVRGRFGLG